MQFHLLLLATQQFYRDKLIFLKRFYILLNLDNSKGRTLSKTICQHFLYEQFDFLKYQNAKECAFFFYSNEF